MRRDFFTGREVFVILVSTATGEAGIAWSNLFGLKVIGENKGRVEIYSTFY